MFQGNGTLNISLNSPHRSGHCISREWSLSNTEEGEGFIQVTPANVFISQSASPSDEIHQKNKQTEEQLNEQRNPMKRQKRVKLLSYSYFSNISNWNITFWNHSHKH